MTVHLHSAIIAAIKSAPSITIYSCRRSSMFTINLQVPHISTKWQLVSCVFFFSRVRISPQLCGFGTHLDSRCRPCDRREGLLLNPRTVFRSVISGGTRSMQGIRTAAYHNMFVRLTADPKLSKMNDTGEVGRSPPRETPATGLLREKVSEGAFRKLRIQQY